ncbi:hypothetical protein [Leekyejoonella antrihumi]|uniref:Uncharacterized protein n=1 Tax=Leekyejoonella antrihumi TaxID=1660198 RepID=A0A563E117_9MICO|nr:hypothetical protein [Leekyejoonella antrihumi]TWP36207.1 hypothetical protein FGL98_10955 [Leekyejoonella antrihumi]
MSHHQIRAVQAVLATAAALGLAACGQAANGAGSSGLPTGTSGTPAPTSAGPTTTSSPDPSHRMTGTPVGQGPVVSEVAARGALMQKSGSLHPAIVRLGSGYEAATLGQGNDVVFWSSTGRTWTRNGTSTRLPVHSGNHGQVTVAGSLLPGAKHATFVVTGAFTGDGTGGALAYGHGPRGWSLITARPDGSLAPSGHGADRLGENGLELNISLTPSGLTTYSMWSPRSSAAFAMQTGRPTIRRWKASGSTLQLTGSNVVTANATEVTLPNPFPAPPGTSSLPDGTWAARLITAKQSGNTISMRVQPEKGRNCMSGAGVCFTAVGPRVSLTMDAYSPTSVLATNSHGQLKHLTAPGWAFTAVEDGASIPLSTYFTDGAPWVVPASLATTSVPSPHALLQVRDGTVTHADAIYTS